MNHQAPLNCYVREELVEKVEAFMENMMEFYLVLNAIPYNKKMTLYLKHVGQRKCYMK